MELQNTKVHRDKKGKQGKLHRSAIQGKKQKSATRNRNEKRKQANMGNKGKNKDNQKRQQMDTNNNRNKKAKKIQNTRKKMVIMDYWTEKKVRRGKWIFKRVKTLYKKPKIMNGTINATQYAIKTGTNTYNLIMKGTKKGW